MAAHPGLSVSDAKRIVSWILTLSDSGKIASLPVSGSIRPSKGYSLTDQGVFDLEASYTDKGGPGIRSLTGTTHLILRNPYVSAGNLDSAYHFGSTDYNGVTYRIPADSSGWLAMDSISLTGINALELDYGAEKKFNRGWQVELRLDRPDGLLLGTGVAGKGIIPMKTSRTVIPMKPVTGARRRDLYLVFRNLEGTGSPQIGFTGIRFMAR